MQLARLGGNADFRSTQHPQYLQAQAQVDEAQRQLDHTVVHAPFAGMVTQCRRTAAAAHISSRRPRADQYRRFDLVDTDNVWVTPILKETDLTYVQAGDQR